MSYKTFVNGFPLNASELNEYLMTQVIAVFVDATARDAAIEAPTEGQFAYLTGANTLTLFNGTAWETFGGAPSLTANRAVATNGSGALTASTVTATELGYLSGVTSSIQTQISAIPTPGLVKITSQAFTSSTAVQVNDVFSSTYENYKVVITSKASANNTLRLRMRTGGTDFTSNKYFLAAYTYSGTVNEGDATSSPIGYSDVTGTSAAEINFFRPFTSGSDTAYTVGFSGPKSGSVVYGPLWGGGGVRENRSDTGFTIYPDSGNITGTVRVYGVLN
jgi:hypothetical protein